jgi:hypothetical protein
MQNIFVFKMQKATRGIVDFYSAGVIPHERM